MSLRIATGVAELIPGVGRRLRTKRVVASLAGVDRNADRRRARDEVSAGGSIPVGHLPSALRVAEAIFRAGVDDDRFEETMSVLCDRYPESGELYVLQAEYFAYKGLTESAWRSAKRGRLLDPSDAGAAAAVVEYAHRILPRAEAEAEAVAVAMVRRFPRSRVVIAAAASQCVTPQHFRRLYAAWTEASTHTADLIPVVEELAMAADRCGHTDTARDLYRRAFTRCAAGSAGPRRVGVRPRRARPRIVMEDLMSALGGAEPSYFLAEDTLLGLARDARFPDGVAELSIGVLGEEDTATTPAAAITVDPRFDPLPAHPRSDTFAARHRSGTLVRLHRYHCQDGRLRRDGAFARWTHAPVSVTRTDFKGLTAPVPGDVDRYLSELYGPWRTVDREFDLKADALNLQVTDDEGLRLHHLARAWRHFRAGRTAAAAKELSAAGEDALTGLV